MEIPKGIYRRGDSLQVLTRKRIKGEKKPLSLSASVQIDEYNSLDEAIVEAKKLKKLQKETISTNGFNNTLKKKVRTVGILGEVMQDVLKEKEHMSSYVNHKIYAKDILEYFPRDIRLDEMQTQQHYKNFKIKMQDLILARPRNNLGSYNTRSLNKRLGFLRDIFKHGLTNRLLSADKLLDNSPDAIARHMGWRNEAVIETKQKNIITPQDEQDIVDEATFDGEQEFVDAFRWLLNGYGMRIEFEFQKLTVDLIKFPRGKDTKCTINFFRNKTQKWSGELPMNEITKEIALRYRSVAFARADKKLFPTMTKRRLRTLFEKYSKRLNLDITPYCTKHTFITRLAENKVPVKTISKIAGISVDTALKYYNQVSDEGMEEAMQSLEHDSSKVVSMFGHNRKVVKQ
jgi:integrase